MKASIIIIVISSGTNVNYITMLASSARKTPFMYIDIQLKPDEYDGKQLVIHKVYLLV
jgi:hypothetical protein